MTREKMIEGMRKLFPNAPIVKIKMLYEKEVLKYVMESENAHKKAAKSKLRFGYAK